MGAIAGGGERVLDESLVRELGIGAKEVDEVVRNEQYELERRERAYRGDRPAPDLHGRTAILVDDGLATGATMRVAVRAVRRQAPARVVVAAPVASREACALLFAQWQGAREDVGEWKQKHTTQVTYSAGLTNQLDEANAKIKATAKAGAISYGHCQDLAANDASKNFDLGVTFGRATCPALPPSSPPSR